MTTTQRQTPIAPSAPRTAVAVQPSGNQIGFVSVVLPCLNEEDGVGQSVAEARRGLAAAGVDGEVIVIDNGSTDRSVARAQAAGAVVVREPSRGYGAAHRAGIDAAKGDVVVMADADRTYDLEGLGALLEPLRHGADMVVGSRLQGEVAPGAMPVLHRYLGTPVITRVIRALTGTKISDGQSGFRAFWRDKAVALNLQTPGMEYASEMLLRAAHAGLDIREVPSDYRRRVGVSKLRTLPDGWRHLRMLLILSPHFSLILPGLLALAFGLVLTSLSLFVPAGVTVGALRWAPMFIGPMLLILGAQATFVGAIAAHRSDLAPPRLRPFLRVFDRADAVNFLLLRCLLVAAFGVALDLTLLGLWLADLSNPRLSGLAGFAQATIVIGVGGIISILAADFSRESLGGDAARDATSEVGTADGDR